MHTWKKFAGLVCIAASMIATRAALALGPPQAEVPISTNAEACKTNATLADACTKGVPVVATSNVSQSASVQAVLIPASLAKRIFGKEVAQNYAVVEVIVSNRDAKASLVVHSVFLDYSNWLLSGTSGQKTLTGLDSTQTATIPSQVASIESRLVRGELLDAQQWTPRNLTMRSLTFLGTAAVAFGFPFSSDVIKGIGAFNGTVVPGAATLWPDGTINQINRISDVGFQTNKIIPKEGSDVMVAFFPIDRFLTPSFRKIFISNPSSLYVPGEMAADPKMTTQLESFVGPLVNTSQSAGATGQQALRSQMLHSLLVDCNSDDKTAIAKGQATDESDFKKACGIQNIFNRISLNNIHLVIEGAMTVDVATVPATIYSVDFDNGNTADIWTNTTGEQTGTINGAYLPGGVPSVVGDNGKAIDGITITPIADGSTDSKLNFTMKLTKCIAPGTKVYFVVNKTSAADSSSGAGSSTKSAAGAKKTASPPVPSMHFEFSPQPTAACPAAADKTAPTTDPKANDPAKPAEKTTPKPGEKSGTEPKS